jgi:DNA-binding transcriptional MerR regulator
MAGSYTVKQLATLAGVTVRTLHHYDQIGLLKPSSVGPNGYRYYGLDALVRLQQILFYRELDVPLDDIRRITGSRDFDVLTALESHRSALLAEVSRIKRLIQTVDRTTQKLKGQIAMSDKQLFRGFSEEEQEKLAAEAEQKWDSRTVRESNARWKQYPPEKKQRILDEGNAVYTDMIAVMSEDPSSESVQAIVTRWHAHMQYFWSPSDDQLLGLAEGYNDDPRFRANFETMQPGLAEYMRAAIKIYVENRK